jgi:hypothetical protein
MALVVDEVHGLEETIAGLDRQLGQIARIPSRPGSKRFLVLAC